MTGLSRARVPYGGIAAFVVGLFSSPAFSLPPHKCDKKELIAAALKSEGQVEIITGIRISNLSNRNIFTTNSDLSIGYNIESGEDKKRGLACIAAKYTNIRLNSDPGYTIPEWTRVSPSSNRDLFLDKLEKTGDGQVLMTAESIVPDKSGGERVGAFLMLVRRSKSLDGGFNVSTADGSKIADVVILKDVVPTQNFLVLTGQRAWARRSLHPTMAELDNLPWIGNPNDIWKLGNSTATREQHYKAARQTRSVLDDLAEKNNWDIETRIKEEANLVIFMKAIKSNRK